MNYDPKIEPMAQHRTRIGTFILLLGSAFALGCNPTPDPPATKAEIASPRRIVLDGQLNFRDLGGYETADGWRIKPGEV